MNRHKQIQKVTSLVLLVLAGELYSDSKFQKEETVQGEKIVHIGLSTKEKEQIQEMIAQDITMIDHKSGKCYQALLKNGYQISCQHIYTEKDKKSKFLSTSTSPDIFKHAPFDSLQSPVRLFSTLQNIYEDKQYWGTIDCLFSEGYGAVVLGKPQKNNWKREPNDKLIIGMYGETTIKFEETTVNLLERNMFFIPKGTKHTISTPGGCMFVYVYPSEHRSNGVQKSVKKYFSNKYTALQKRFGGLFKKK